MLRDLQVKSAPGPLVKQGDDDEGEIAYQELGDSDLGRGSVLPRSLTGKLKERIPALKWLPSYDVKEHLVSDIIGGTTIGMVCLAQTLAHAAIATTETIQGPYCAFVPTLVYAFLGTSPHASISSGAIAAILIADQLRPWDDIVDRTHMASMLALITGAALVLMGIFKLSSAVRFLSVPTLSGFVTGGSLLIIVQQTRNLFGFRDFPHCEGLVTHILTTVKWIPKIDPVSLVLGIFLIGVLDGSNRLKKYCTLRQKKGDAPWAPKVKRITEMKEIVVALIGVTFGFLTAHGSEPILVCVGSIPAGLPPFEVPWEYPAFKELEKHPGKLHSFIAGGLLVAFTSFLTTYATTKKMALKFEYDLDASQEMMALGCSGIAGSFFGAFPPSGSLSRTGLAADCGVKTQLGGVFAAGVIGLGLCFLTPALVYLPKCALAAVIMKSTMSLIDFDTPLELWKYYWRPKKKGGLKRDLKVWLVAFAGTLGLGVIYGIALAVCLSVFLIVKDATSPSIVVLGRVEEVGGQWRNILDWEHAKTIDKIMVIEFRGPLSFASSDYFQEQVEAIRHKWRKHSRKVEVMVLSLVAVHYLDLTAVKMLEDLLTEWKRDGVTCVISGAKHQVRLLIEDRLVKKKNLLSQMDFMISIDEAVTLAQRYVRKSSKNPLP
eukprot:CAMPEP_0178385150 /NCGR_PEP_ID=MMETSP0689_2-20121128/7886_1 /TAXON_ID=160604 /ORGANISM="Amphidinium massartii, Strain CS-259" /LENGTH=658 /DNA_ID=CAMNT_0020005427 /DNA_START=114 /DNA_END=2087 /DNA_ORIENTATION=+